MKTNEHTTCILVQTLNCDNIQMIAENFGELYNHCLLVTQYKTKGIFIV